VSILNDIIHQKMNEVKRILETFSSKTHLTYKLKNTWKSKAKTLIINSILRMQLRCQI